MIYINEQQIGSSPSQQYVTTDTFVVGKLVKDGVDYIEAIVGNYIAEWQQSKIRPNAINFRIQLSNTTQDHPSTMITIRYRMLNGSYISEIFYLKYNYQSTTPSMNLFIGGDTSYYINTTDDEAEISINPQNITKYIQTKGDFSKAYVDLSGKMIIVTIAPSDEFKQYRNDVIKLKCFDAKGNYKDYFIYVKQDNSTSPTVSGDIKSSVTTSAITFTSTLQVGLKAGNVVNSTFKDAPDWLHIELGSDVLKFTYSTDTNETPYIQSAVVPFYFEVDGLNYLIKKDVDIKNIPSKTAIYINDSLEENRDFFASANEGSIVVMTYTLANVANSIELVAPNDFYNVFDVTIDRELYTVIFTALFDNESSENDKEFTGLYFRGYDTNGNAVNSPVFTVIQSADVASIQFPLWKREILEIKPVEDYVDYRLVADLDKVIYAGRAYAQGKVVTLHLNELVRPFLEQSIDITYLGWQNTNGYGKFKLQTLNENGVYEDYMTIRAFNDWSYENRIAHPQCLQDPISRVLDYRQKALFSVIDRYGEYTDASKTRCWIAKDGVNYQDPINANNEIATIVVHNLSDCDTISCLYTHVNSEINIDYEDEYKVECTPYKYCVYYQNLYGGYDSLLLNKASQTSLVTKSNTIANDVSYDSKAHETRQYRRTAQRKFKLITPRLTDEQSVKMCHLLESNQVWLHNLENGEIIPINIDDATTHIKTFISNGRKFINYTINATEAFTKLRY